MLRHPTARTASVAALLATGLFACQINVKNVRPDAPADGAEEEVGASVADAATLEELAALEEEEVEEGPVAIVMGTKLDLAVDMPDNPVTYGQFEARGERLLRRSYNVDAARCDGYVPRRPTLVIDAPEGYEHLRLRAEGDAEILFVELPGGQYHCVVTDGGDAAPTLEARNWPQGQYRVYVGKRARRARLDYTLTVEDMARAKSVPWLDAAIPTLTLDGESAAPRYVELAVGHTAPEARSAEHGDTSCAPQTTATGFAQTPDLRLDVEKPLRGVLGTRTDAPVSLTLIGPVPEDRRDIPTRCIRSWREELDLAPGTYFVRVGVDAENLPALGTFYAHGAAAQLDPLSTVPTIRDGLDALARRLNLHLPFLDSGRLVHDDRLRHAVFANVPASLYVVPTTNLSAATGAQVVIAPEADGLELLDPARPHSFPLQDELLVLLDGSNLVLAADGSLFRVDATLLKPAEQADAIVLPPVVRNTQTPFELAIKLAGPEDAERLEQYRLRHERFTQCVDAAVARGDDETRSRERCGLSRLQDDDRRMWRQLEDNRTRRRDAALQLMREKLANLVLVR